MNKSPEQTKAPELWELAYRSHSNTSFSPERRANSAVNGYFAELENFASWIDGLKIKHPAIANELDESHDRFKDGYKEKTYAYLNAHSRVISSMITGPANFPVRRNEKANASSDNRMQELFDLRPKAEKYIERLIKRASIEAAGGEIGVARKKLDAEKKAHSGMKKANAIIRSKPKNESTPEKVAELVELLGMDELRVSGLFDTDSGYSVGFQSFQLTNCLNRIKGAERRVKDLEQRETATDKEQEVDGIQVVENAEQNRLQLIFPDKPSEAVRKILKSHGFRWSPRNTAWQRQLTNNARYSLKRVLPLIKEEMGTIVG